MSFENCNPLMNKKVKVASLSIFSNIFLILIKLIVGIITNSVSIISEAIHSGIDLVASVIAFFSVKISSKPPDEEHAYGHGKYENVSGVIEALLIFIAAIWIIVEAVKRLLENGEVKTPEYGIIVMAISMVVNYIVSSKLYKTAKETDSIALEADALHLKTDVYTSLGVAVGLLLLYLTRLPWIDAVVAILVAFMIIYESTELIKKAFNPLVDRQLPDEEINQIEVLIDEVLHANIGAYHSRLRTRKSGDHKYIDFTIFVNGDTSVKNAHDVCNEIEDRINANMKISDINIHIEPIA